MATQWNLDLAEPVNLARTSWLDILHAVCCAFFGESDAEHDADVKPFATRPVGSLDAVTGVIQNWLPDTRPPVASVPVEIRLGRSTVAVSATRMHRSSLAQLANGLTGRRIRFVVATPAKFRHHGRDYPLPDPYLTFTTLGRRLRATHPDATTDEQVRDLARSVVVYHHDIHTEAFTWHGDPSAGFVGTVTFGVPAAIPPRARALFHTLGAFAALAGIGHGTTHGLGAVTIQSTCPDQSEQVDVGHESPPATRRVG